MTVDEVYTLMQYIVSKNIQQGYLSPADFNKVINQAQKSYVAYMLGDVQRYAPKRPIPPTEYGNTLTARQRLSPIIKEDTVVVDNAGYSAYPTDYIQTDAMWTSTGFQRVRQVAQDKLWSYYNSVIDPVAQNPIYLLQDTGFQFYPENIGTAKLSYVSEPPLIEWAYTVVSGRPVYDPALSIDPVWADVTMMDIISRALVMVGVNLQAPVLMQYANDLKNNGQ